jgi:hypothetical protein
MFKDTYRFVSSRRCGQLVRNHHNYAKGYQMGDAVDIVVTVAGKKVQLVKCMTPSGSFTDFAFVVVEG